MNYGTSAHIHIHKVCDRLADRQLGANLCQRGAMAAASSWQQYLPPSCPASPNLTEERIDIVRKTWLTLKSGQGKGERDRLGSNPSVQDAMDLLAVMYYSLTINIHEAYMCFLM